MDNIGVAVEEGLAKAKLFSLYFIKKTLESGLFFEQFYAWIPLYNLIYPSFAYELAQYHEKVRKFTEIYTGTETNKLVHGITNPENFSRLLDQRISFAGWGFDSSDYTSRLVPTMRVLMAILKTRKEFFEDQGIQLAFQWICSHWQEDLYKRAGLSFKGAMFLNLVNEVNWYGDGKLFANDNLVFDTFKHIETTQTTKGTWGFYFREYDGINLDEELGSPLIASIICSNLFLSKRLVVSVGLTESFKKITDKSIKYLVGTQHLKGFWNADSIDYFLKSLGWGIKCFATYLSLQNAFDSSAKQRKQS